MKKVKDRGEQMKCNCISQAREILAEKGIKFDSIYENVYSRRNSYGIESEIRGVHAYINNGENCNVAYYTPGIEILTIINDGKGRVDGSTSRKYIWRRENE